MKSLLCGVGLLAVLVSGCMTSTTAASMSATGYRLTAELHDGSRVIGRSQDGHFQFHSPILGDLKLSLAEIRSVECLAGTNQFKVITTGGDSLKAGFAMAEIRLETIYGAVKLPVSLIKSVRVSEVADAARLKDGLIGLWSADGNAVDSVNGNNGMLQNVSFTDGVAGQAFLFSPDSYPSGTYVGVQIHDRPLFALTHSLTVEGWIRPRGNGYMIFFRGDHRPGMDPYHLSLDGHLHLEFGICDEDGNTATVRTPVGLGKWIHVAGVLDDNTGTMSLYTNGVLAARTETTVRPFGALLAGESPGIGIGNVNDGGNNFPFNGEIDELGLYDRALSESEVNTLYLENQANAGGRAGPLPTRAAPVFGMPVRNRFPVFNSRQQTR